METLKFLVTGTGRSGTVYLARLMTSLGLPCGHECIFDYDDDFLERLLYPRKRRLSNCSTHEILNHNAEIPQWVTVADTVAESSYMICPHLDIPELAGIPLIHGVRNPFKVISSFILDLNYFERIDIDDPWQKKIYHTLPELKEVPSQIERACLYYILWNEKIEQQEGKRPYFREQVEKIDQSEKFFNFIDKTPDDETFSNKEANKFKYRPKDLSVNDIPPGSIKKRFLEKMRKYGYYRITMI